MRGGHQLVRFPGNPDEQAILREVECLELSAAKLPLCRDNLRKFSRLLHASTLELDRIARCIEHDPLLAVSVLRLVTDELSGVNPVRISDCIVLAGRDRLLTIANTEFVLAIPAIDDFAERSRILAWTASRLADLSGAVDPPAARLAGLLHALGELPILLSGRGIADCVPEVIAGWGKRLALTWRFPAVLVNVIASYDGRIGDSASAPMQLILKKARRLLSCQLPEMVSPPPLLDSAARAKLTVECQRFI